MPYVPSKDRPRLAPLILALKEKTLALVERTRGNERKFWGYLRHVAMRVLEETALNAAEQYQGKRGRRYWLVVDQAGICMNIAFELYDRVLSKKPGRARIWFEIPMVAGALHPVPEDAGELNPSIDPNAFRRQDSEYGALCFGIHRRIKGRTGTSSSTAGSKSLNDGWDHQRFAKPKSSECNFRVAAACCS